MRKILIALSAVVLVMSACQKEGSFEETSGTPGSGGGTGGGTTPTGLLARSVYVAGADSIMVDYGYDASKRLVTFNYTTTGGGNQFKRVVRNSAGIMTRYVVKSEELLSLGIDSIITNVNYDAAKSQYTYSISSVNVSGMTYVDSTHFTYDGSGNLTAKTAFARGGLTPYQPYQKSEYTYASGNVTSEKFYSANASRGWDLEGTYNYTYDNKVNPVKLGAEAMIALDDASYFSNNNATVLSYVDGSDPSYNYTLTSTFTYNSANKPSGGTAVETPGSASYTLRYYYQ